MPFSLFNKVVSWMLKKRIHQIELFMKYPHDVQSEVLKKLITQSKDTLIGKEYDFKSINNYNDFSKRIPARTYEEFFTYINKTIKGEQNVFWNESIKWFAQSSGTTNSKSKFIPVSNSALENCHFKAGKDMLCLYINNNENSSIFSGKSLRLGGSRKIYENNNLSKVSDLDVLTVEKSHKFLTAIDGAIKRIDAERGDLGSTMNRMQHTIDNLSNTVVNTQAARGRIEDADMAAETANLAKNQILQQAATAMLAQANAAKNATLKLVTG